MSNILFQNIDVIGDNICERYIEDGVEKLRRVPFEPTFYHHCNSSSDLFDIYGKPVVPKTFPSIHEANQWIKRMKDMKQEVLGMDDYALQYIHENYNGPLSYNLSELRIAFIDIEVYSTEGFPYPNICKWEIDAISHYDSKDDVFYVFSTREWWREKSVLDKSIVDRVQYQYFKTEKQMLLAYVSFWRKNTPSLITGWNSEFFDIPYIINRLKRLFGESAPNKLSPWGKIKEVIIKEKNDKGVVVKEHQTYKIMGVAALDYLALYKKFTFKTRPTYKLDFIALVELKTRKLEYEGSLSTLAIDNPQRYVDYNIYDVDIIRQLDQSLLLFELVVSLSYYSHMPFDNVMSPLRTWDAIIYNSLMDQNIVVPENKQASKEPYEGAFVKDPFVGYHEWVVSFDLTSLYPHLIMQYNISPETIRGRFEPECIDDYVNKLAPVVHNGYSCAPNGMMYDREQRGIIPTEIEKVFLQRKSAKGAEWSANGLYTRAQMVLDQRHTDGVKVNGDEKFDAKTIIIDEFFEWKEEQLSTLTDSQLKFLIKVAKAKERSSNVEQQARKVLINSLYGALGNRFFRYYDLRNAEAITTAGQLSIRWIERKLNEYFNTLCSTEDYQYVIYIDTDSVYLRLDKFVNMMLTRSNKTEEEVGIPKIVDMLDAFAKTKVEPYIGDSYQELADYMNAYAQKMFMDREVIANTGFWTAKKRYALNVWDSEGKRKYDDHGNLQPKLKIMGIETQRSSTPVFVQEALYESIRIILQEDEKSLQNYFEKVEADYSKRDYREIAQVSSANNIMQYATPDYYPLKNCRGPIKGVLAYNRVADKIQGIDTIRDGEKVALLTLKEPNILGTESFAYPSGESIPAEFGIDIAKMIDYRTMMDKTYTKPLSTICEAIGWNYEEVQTLDWLFG